jgi:hypothetical protein
LAAAGANAQAAWQVQAQTYADSDIGALALEDYNYSFLSPYYFNGVGSTSYIVQCSAPIGGSANCGATGSGPVTASPSLTSVYVSSIAQGSVTDLFNNTTSGSATARAYADLLNGTIGLAGTSTPSFNAGQTAPVSTSMASLSGSVGLDISGAGPATVTDIGVSFTAYGSFTSEGANPDTASLRSILYVDNASFDETLYDAPGSETPTLSGCCGASGWVSETYQLNGSTLSFTGTLAVTGADPTVGAYLEMQLGCSSGYVCGYYHTGVLDLTLPQGTTITSDPGGFLSEPFVEAPEPDAWILMILGVGAVGAALRGRRRTAQA